MRLYNSLGAFSTIALTLVVGSSVFSVGLCVVGSSVGLGVGSLVGSLVGWKGRVGDLIRYRRRECLKGKRENEWFDLRWRVSGY